MTLAEAAVLLLKSIDEETVDTGNDYEGEDVTLVDGHIEGVEGLRQALGCWKSVRMLHPEVLEGPIKKEVINADP